MKRILNALKWAWTVYRKPHMFQKSMLQIMEGQMKFLQDVNKENRPMVTHLSSLIIDDEGKEHDVKILSLWCGIGDEASPIQRCVDLAQENRRLKLRISELLKESKTD
jgi:hypothetical protein